MADYYTNLVTTRDNIAVQLVDMTASPKPSYRIDGQQVATDGFAKLRQLRLRFFEAFGEQNPLIFVKPSRTGVLVKLRVFPATKRNTMIGKVHTTIGP